MRRKITLPWNLMNLLCSHFNHLFSLLKCILKLCWLALVDLPGRFYEAVSLVLKFWIRYCSVFRYITYQYPCKSDRNLRAKAKIISGLILHAISLTKPKNDKSLQDDKRKRLMGIWEAWALHFLSICRQFRVKCLCCIVCDFKRVNQFQMQFYFSLFLNLPNLCWFIKTFKLFSKPN